MTPEADSGERLDEAGWAARRRKTGRVTPEDWRQASPLLAYQSRVVEAVSTHAVTVVEKGRRTGVTWAAAAAGVVISAAGEGGMDTLYMGTSQDMAREFIDAAADWARRVARLSAEVQETLFDDGSEEGVQAFRIRFASGHAIVALTSKPRSLRGRQGFAILDEAAFVDNLAELMKAALAFLIWGGRVLVISTHNGDSNPFNTLVQDIRAGRLDYHLIRVSLDDALDDGLYERIALVAGGRLPPWSPESEAGWRERLIRDYRDGADEELFCIPSAGSGAFLPAALIEARMVDAPVLRLSFPPEFTHRPEGERRREVAAWIADTLTPTAEATLDPALLSAFGMDVGRYRDLSVIAPMQITRMMRRVVPFLIEMERVPFQQQEQVRDALVELLMRLGRFIGGMTDATGLGAQIAESATQRFGESCVAVKMSVEWYRTAMPPLRAAFEDDAISVPRDAEVAADLRALKVVRGVAMLPQLRQRSGSGGQRHGDAAIAIALAHAASRAPHEAYDYEAAGPAGRDGDRPRGRLGRAAPPVRDNDLPSRRDGIDDWGV